MNSNFPQDQIRAALRKQFLDSDDPFTGASTESGTLHDVLPMGDSLSALQCLLTIEKCLGIELPARLIRSGGYNSAADMIENLINKSEKYLSSQKPKSVTNHKRAA